MTALPPHGARPSSTLEVAPMGEPDGLTGPAPPPTKTICFDLDGTLCTNTFGDYEAAEPFPWAVHRVNRLARAGHRIVIFTARGTATGIEWEDTTRAQLERWGVMYDDLRFGKPSADVYVDDRAVHTADWRCADISGAPGFTTAGAELPEVLPSHLTCVVEVGRTFGGDPLFLEGHCRRLLELAGQAGIAPAPTLAELTETVRSALARTISSDDDIVFTISVSAPGHAGFADALDGASPRYTATCRGLREAATGLSPFLLSQAGDCVVLRAAVGGQRPGWAWPLALGEDASLRDALGGRLGLVADARVVLQEPAAPAAVASQWFAQVARKAGVEIQERPIRGEDLETAAEGFVVGFPFCLLPLGTIEGHVSWPRAPGTVTRTLLGAWSSSAGVDLGGQMAAGGGGHHG